MAFHKTYANQILHDIALLVMHFYKKGVYDGGKSGDNYEIWEVTRRYDFDTTFQMLSEYSNKPINFHIYFNYVQTQFAKIRTRAIQHWFTRVTGGYVIKEGICLICDEYYRKGLERGLEVGREKADAYFEGGVGFRDVENTLRSEEQFLIEIKAEAMRVSVEREIARQRMDALVEFVASTLRKKRDYYLKK